MKIALVFVLSTLLFSALRAQKPSLDTGILYRWPAAVGGSLSPDGRYAAFVMWQQPINSRTLVIKSLSSKWERRVEGSGNISFTRNSRFGLFIKGGDTMTIIRLGATSEEAIPGVGSFQLYTRGIEEYLLYSLKDSARRLIIRSLMTGREMAFAGIDRWQLSPNGILLEGAIGVGRHNQSIAWVELATGKDKIVWEGKISGDIVMDSSGKQVAFTGESSDGRKGIWYCGGQQQRAQLAATDSSVGIDSGLIIGKVVQFSGNGEGLFFFLHENDVMKPSLEAVLVDIWSYQDAKLQSQQLGEIGPAQEYLSYLRFDQGHVVRRLQRSGEKMPVDQKIGDEYVLFDSTEGDSYEWSWSAKSQPNYELVSIPTGKRAMIRGKQVTSSSPGGRFLTLVDRRTSDTYSYEIPTGKVRHLNLGLSLPNDVDSESPDTANSHWLIIAGWLPKDSGIIAYDMYDVWLFDPLQQRPALNLTHRFGRDHQIVFRLAKQYKEDLIDEEDLLLSSFNKNSKKSGFWRLLLHSGNAPQLLTEGPYSFNRSSPFLKADNAEVYLVKRESASESPNYFSTSDFKHLEPVSHVYPERDYRWMTTKLVNFKRVDGRDEKGVLYLPENFDTTRRYPVIIHYYTTKSDAMYQYHWPRGNGGDLNIPWFVSRGYVVFTPDIHFTIGNTGESVLSTVNGAAAFLKQLPGLDPAKIGLQGHSYGGWETNYLVTHSQTFAAAVASSGECDLLMEYGELWGDRLSKEGFFEIRQGRMGATPWEHPERYLTNSPILAADKVGTPLLMVSNKRDGNVSFAQGLAFFLALRRLGKRAWMLQYDRGGHGLDGKELQDYLLRTTQFFDHYLKGKGAPIWMTQGIPAKRKGLDRGFQIDNRSSEPGDGLLMR